MGSARSTERTIKKVCPDLRLHVGYGCDYINVISNGKTFAEVDGGSRIRSLGSAIEKESEEEIRGYVARFWLKHKEVELMPKEKEFFLNQTRRIAQALQKKTGCCVLQGHFENSKFIVEKKFDSIGDWDRKYKSISQEKRRESFQKFKEPFVRIIQALRE